MSVKNFYRFSYYGSPTGKHKQACLLLHQLRDADAAMELADILYEQGYQYGGLLLNYPVKSKEETRVVDAPFLQPDDLLLIAGRPPLDDEVIKPRKLIVRSHTTLEDQVFSTLKRYFRTCARSEVTLTRELSRRLPKNARRYRDAEFGLYHARDDVEQLSGQVEQLSGQVERLGGRKAKDIHPRATIVYLVFTRTTWPGGPGLFCAFGMGGPETLLWCYLLRTKFRHLVGSSEFVMAELVGQPFEQPKDDLRFADAWDVRILADIPIK